MMQAVLVALQSHFFLPIDDPISEKFIRNEKWQIISYFVDRRFHLFPLASEKGGTVESI
jgi:hypothetical protein